MQFRLALAFALISLAACGMSYTLDESEGVEAARTEFAAHGIVAASTRPLGPVTVDGVAITFTVDGWSLADQLGFEYVSEHDPDFTRAVTDLGVPAETAKLQAAVDTTLAAEPGTHVLIVRTWGHETFELARDQLRGYVDQWLIAQGR